MQRILLKSKIHRARVTDANLDYEGSLTIDRNLMELADIAEFEQIKIYNVSNGARFDTYAMSGPRGRGDICLNGAAARMGARGDLIIIASYGNFDEAEVRWYRPKIVLVAEDNTILRSSPLMATAETV